MNTQKQIFEKLLKHQNDSSKYNFKTNSKKLNLSKLDDLRKYRDTLKDMDSDYSTKFKVFYDEWSNLINLAPRLASALFDVEQDGNDYTNYIQEVLNFSTSLIEDLRDYGVDPNSIPEFEEITNIMANLEDNIFQASERFEDVQDVINVI